MPRLSSLPSPSLIRALLLAAIVQMLFFSKLEKQLFLLVGTVACLLAAAILTINGDRKQNALRFPTGRIAMLALAHLGWLFCVSAQASTLPWASYWTVWVISLLPIGYLLARTLPSDRHADDRLWIAAGVAVTAISIWSNVKYLTGEVDRATGSMMDYNAYGAILYLFLLPGMAYYCDASRSPRSRYLCLAMLIVLFFSFFTVQSRGATAVLLLISIPMFFGMHRAGINVLKPGKWIAMVAILGYVAMKLTSHNAARTLALSTDPSTLFRLMMWKSAWAAWLDHPWLGTGLGTYRMQYLHYRLPQETDTSGDLAHNDYLQMLMEGGPVLLLLLLCWLGVSLWLCWKLWRNTAAADVAARRDAAFALPMALPVIGLFAHANVNFIFYVAPLSLIAGLYLAQAQRALGPVAIHSPQWPIKKKLGNGVLTLAGALIVGGLALDWITSIMLVPRLADTVLTVADKPAPERFRIALILSGLRPQNMEAEQALTTAASEIAMVLRDRPDNAQTLKWARLSLDHGKRWLELSPGHPFAYYLMANLLWAFPALKPEMAPLPDSPEALLRIAIDRYPAQPDDYRLLASYLRANGRDLEALQVLSSSLPWMRIPPTSKAEAQSRLQLIQEGRLLGQQLLQSAPNGGVDARVQVMVDALNDPRNETQRYAAP
jgi:O-antigen ligase